MSRSMDAERWYDRSGTFVKEVIRITKANPGGRAVKPNLADARKQGLLPSVTSVCSITEDYGLTMWKLREVAKAAIEVINTTHGAYNTEELVQYILGRAHEKGMVAVDFGTELHDCIEHFLKGETGITKAEHLPFIDAFSQWYADRAEDFRGRIIDFKTQGNTFPTFYDSWVIQLSSYRTGAFWGTLETPPKPLIEHSFASEMGYAGKIDFAWPNWQAPHCVSVAISSVEPGKIEMKAWPAEKVRWAWRVFRDRLRLWKTQKRYDPSFVRDQTRKAESNESQ